METLVNGLPETQIPVNDRGFLYGDGCFTTLAVYRERPLVWSGHWERLVRCLDRLRIPRPEYAILHREVWQFSQGRDRAVIKIILTRGTSGRGYRGSTTTQPTRVVQRHPWPDYPAAYFHEGIDATLCTTRLARNPTLAGMKHLNRLEQILAREEWDAPFAEGLLLDHADQLVSGTFTNLFFVREGTLHTPDLRHCGVAGVMRAVILKTAILLGTPVVQGGFTLADLAEAEEVFVSNSLIGIWPVRSVNEQPYPVGPLTRALQQAAPAAQAMVPHD